VNNILIPALTGPSATSVLQWKNRLTDADKQWRTGDSAKTLAHAWQEANGFPAEVHAVLRSSPHFRDIEMLLAIPEHQVPFPGGARPSQNDVWVLARAEGSLVSIAVEGNVPLQDLRAESFGPTMQEWLRDDSREKRDRMAFLAAQLDLPTPLPAGIRYQLVHRTASAVIEAARFNAAHAVMLVHSFGDHNELFQEFREFVAMFGCAASPNTVLSVWMRLGVSLHFAWVTGDTRYREKRSQAGSLRENTTPQESYPSGAFASYSIPPRAYVNLEIEEKTG